MHETSNIVQNEHPRILSTCIINVDVHVSLFTEARFDDRYVHIGAYDFTDIGRNGFKWITNQASVSMTYTNWLSGNPKGNGRRCIAVQISDIDDFGKWTDQFCWLTLPFVCEVML